MNLFTAAKRRLKFVFDRIGNERWKLNILQAIPFWIASLLTGLAAVLYARLFFLAEKGTSYFFTHYAWSFFFITPICFIIGWWLVRRFAPYSRGSGIPQVMASIELANPKNNEKIGRLLSVRIIIVKVLSSLVMVFGGGVIGREGPTIQIAGSIFRKVNELLPAWWPRISKKNMIMTGAAAGLAAAFNTPLGGIVFAVEELTRTHINYFKTAIFTAVIISGLTAQALLGPYLYLGYPVIGNLSGFIFLGVIAVAIITGLAGSGMAKTILWVMKWKKGLNSLSKTILFLIISGLLIASAAFFIDASALGSGKELMANVLFSSQKYLSWYIPFLRAGGSILSFSSGAAGGIFAPSLSAGASVGSVLAGWFHLSDSNTNLLVLAGMVGFLTGVTRTPFTSAIIVLEMTDRHNLIFHLMLAAMVASMVAVLVDRHSFYDHLKTQYLHDVLHEEKMESKETVVPEV
jgi:H+/Cl- antiporter ClcA